MFPQEILLVSYYYPQLLDVGVDCITNLSIKVSMLVINVEFLVVFTGYPKSPISYINILNILKVTFSCLIS